MEARLLEGALLKKLVESIHGLLTEANLDCTESGIHLQAMDAAHVSLVSLFLRAEGFHHFRVVRPLTLGISMAALAKILKVF